MISFEVASSMARFFDGGRGPSHDELTRLIRRAGLDASDPRGREGDLVGKMKRVREVLAAAVSIESAVQRARTGASDAPLVLGTTKDLLEAVARHVLTETTGAYPTSESVAMTLFQAFDRVGLSTPGLSLIDQLDSDPQRALHQVIYMLGVVVNRLRNHKGTGHGRPHISDASDTDSQLSSLATAITSHLLLAALRAQRGSGLATASV